MKKQTLIALSLAALIATPALAEHGKDGHPHRGPGHMFEKADTNKDGVVTKEEFRAQSDKFFAKLDTNGDGKITKQEQEEAHAKFKQKREEHRAKREAAKAE